MSLITLDHVSLSFGNEQVLERIKFRLNPGEVVGIIGANGSGKTSLLRLMTGLLSPQRGTVRVHERTLGAGELATDMGILIETPQFIKHLTGRENLQYLARIKQIISDKDIQQVLDRVGLGSKADTIVKNYSLGMRQRLGIAQAVMESPTILLFDEPTNALDDDGVEMFRHLVQEMKQQGVGIVLVSHRKDEINEFTDRVLQLLDNQLLPVPGDLYETS